MQLLFIISLLLILGVLALLGYISNQLKQLENNKTSDQSFVLLNQNVQNINTRLDKTTDSINLRLDKAAQVIMLVQKELGTVQERFKGFEEFNELLHPKMRGNIGEEILSDMLVQILSTNHYELQYKFKDGQIVDALIKTKSGFVPVDSKFPLENFKQMSRSETEDQKKLAAREFKKAVKKHIDDISKKYILPDEGTTNFAVMYVPSENVYYHILIDDELDLLTYAKTKNVLVTSPHAFFYFLQVILMGMERTKLQEQAQKIWDILKGVQTESVKFTDTLGLVSRHISNAKTAMDATHLGYEKLTNKLNQIQLLEETSTVHETMGDKA